ncbi:MAG: hypothetical protein ACP5OO_10585 [Chloroflexia bacterium]
MMKNWWVRGLETTELLLILGILGVIIAGILYLLGGAFGDFANHIIATLFSW